MKKRIIALALCLVMLLGCLGMGVDALTDTAPLYDRLIAAQTAEEFDAIAESATEEELSALTEDQLVEISNRYAAILGEDAQEPITYASSSVNNVGPLVKKDAVQTKARLAKAKVADAGQNGPFEPSDADHPGLFLNKNVTDNGDGTYKLTLESFVTGNVEITQEKIPADIVLVLDTSGSMKENITVADTRYNTIDDLYKILDSKYGGESGTYFWGKWNNYKIRFHEGKWQTTDGFGGNWHDITSDDLYGDQAIKISKLNAMKIAVKNFVDQVQADTKDEDGKLVAEHRISVVPFASNVGEILPLTSVNTDDGANAVKTKIDVLSANDGTQSGKGMESAKTIISKIDKDRISNKVVVMFTDGTPGDYGFDDSVANQAINASWDLKNKYATTVYTIGVFESKLNASNDKVTVPSSDVSKYMHFVSSNFKYATNMDTPGTPTYPAGNDNYFLLASSASEMNDIFSGITDKVSGGASMQLGAETVLRDIVTADFDIVAPNGIADIKVYTADYIDRGADGKRIFAERKDWKKYNANVEIKDGNKVEVTGFDYSSDENCVTDTKNADGSTTYTGRKLIVEFDIKVSDSCMGGGKFPTNTTASAIYDKGGNLVGVFPVPEVNVPRKTFDLTIKKEAAKDTKIDENQTFVFTVKGTDEHTKDVNTQVIIKGDGSVTLKDLPVGKYTVTEDTNWSWRYNPTKNDQPVNADNTAQQTVTFVNRLNNNKWLSFLNRVTNVFGTQKAS